MKRHLEYKIASAIAVSTLAIPSAIYAQPVMDVVYPGVEVVINTPEDFINTFCSVKALNEFNEEINVLILEVNPENYGIILAGKAFYDDYCINNPDMANAINTILIESPAMRSYEDYFNQAIAVQTALEQEAALQAEMEQQAALQAEMEQAALMEAPVEMAAVEEVVIESPVELETPELSAEPAAQEAITAQPVITVQPVYPEAVEMQQDIVEVTSVSESPLLTMLGETNPVEEIEPVNETVPETDVVEEIQPEVEPITPLPIAELTEPAESQTETITDVEPAAPEKMETTSETQETSAAQSFVDRYLKDDAGNIYASATPSNYTRIIGSLKEWNNLPVSVQNEINSILLSTTGVSYQALLQQAQQIASGAINRVNTGSETHSGLFGFTALFSALAAGLFYDKQRGR